MTTRTRIYVIKLNDTLVYLKHTGVWLPCFGAPCLGGWVGCFFVCSLWRVLHKLTLWGWRDWQTVRKFLEDIQSQAQTPRRNSTPTKNGKRQSTSKGKAQISYVQYASVFQNEGKSELPDLGNSPYPSMPKIDTFVDGVEKLLLRLNPRTAVGPDMVPTRILMDHTDYIALILQSIFQHSLDTRMVPHNWKNENVTVVFRKGNRQVASNYRPVPLTCAFRKVQENIVFWFIMDHVVFHKILMIFQHGFR